MDILEEQNHVIDAMRVKAFPFTASVEDFIAQHDQVFVIEQNRDAQFRSLLVNELEINPKKLIKVLNYDGMPVTADCILKQILPKIMAENNGVHAHSQALDYEL
jgi:2-oxoglutarate ferredoxin oxidoreductase subunit alpha